MNPRDRRIRQLRLVCQSEEHARRGQTLLEDALRTASLDDEGRVVIIRSLALGRLSPHASPMEWSRRVEQRVRAVKTAAVFAETAGAAAAEAVWFPNAIELWVALAARAAGGLPCTEWFWISAAPGWSSRLEAPATLRLAFQRLTAADGWPATWTLARRLANDGRLMPLLRALSPDDVRPWLEPRPRARSESSSGAGLPPAESSDDAPPSPSFESHWPAGWRSIAAQCLAEFPSGDARLVWLAAAALASTSPMPPRLAEAQWLAEQSIRQLLATRAEADDGPVPKPEPRCASGPDAAMECSDLSAAGEPRAEQSPPVVLERSPNPQGELTGCGGLFLLIGLFERLGIAGWPDAGAAAWEALSLALQRCRPAGHDPLPRLLPAVPRPDATPMPFVLGSWPGVEGTRGPQHPRLLARWRGHWRVLFDATGRLPLAAWPRGARPAALARTAGQPVRRAAAVLSLLLSGPREPASLHPRVLALALGAHRLSRRMTGLGLKTLVRRPARVLVTDTHIDVFFRPTEADARIRRAALDVDPGWVPWLGRTVSFYYTRED